MGNELVIRELYEARVTSGLPLPNTGLDPAILRSWQRSAEKCVLNFRDSSLPRVVSRSDLRARQDAMGRLVCIARSGVEMLHRKISDLGYVVLLADYAGVVVDSAATFTTCPDLQQMGLRLGSCWSEADEGTCGIGTAIAERQAILVHQGEHYRTPHTTLTCSASPIFSADGAVAGVLDATALKSPGDRLSQRFVLKLVEDTARAIENAFIIEEHQHFCTVRFGPSMDFLEVTVDGLLIIDDSGKIVAANRYARDVLGFANDQLVGTSFRTTFGVSIESLLSSARPQKVAARGRAGDQAFFAIAKPAHHDRIRRHIGGRRFTAERFEAPNDSAALRLLDTGDLMVHRAVERARRIVDKDIPIMLLGETGTGKEVFAQAIHLASSRSSGPFVPINCGAIPESLIESELFGYVGGAFTGAARTGSKGKIASANGGTLFLDEIGDMPLHLQTRLLRALAERKVTPVGGDTTVNLDIQIICATHRDLAKLIASAEFREDLFYRLAGIEILLPPLRERSDKRKLAEAILQEQARSIDRAPATFAPSALNLIEEYHWPGNIRQLVTVLRAALALSDSNVIEAADLPIEGPIPRARKHAATRQTEDRIADRTGAPPCEAKRLTEALKAHSWNVTRAAMSLRVSRATAYRMIKKYGIVSPNAAFSIPDTSEQ